MKGADMRSQFVSDEELQGAEMRVPRLFEICPWGTTYLQQEGGFMVFEDQADYEAAIQAAHAVGGEGD